jgi:hypothetical protein
MPKAKPTTNRESLKSSTPFDEAMRRILSFKPPKKTARRKK